jgi:hypothetical protein
MSDYYKQRHDELTYNEVPTNFYGTTTGRIYLGLSNPVAPLFSQAANLNSPFLPGSSFEMVEDWDITLRIDRPELVDSDQRWFYPIHYLGTWQGLGASFTPRAGDQFSGRLIQTSSTFSYETTYTTGLRNPLRQYKGATSAIDNCSFATTKIGATISGLSVELQTPTSQTDLFTIRESLKAARLEDFFVSQRLRGMGLYLNPGVSFVSSNYSVAAVSLAPIEPNYTEPQSCAQSLPPPPADCQREFQQQIIDTGRGYRTETEAAAVYGTFGLFDNFVCSTGELIPYWSPAAT